MLYRLIKSHPAFSSQKKRRPQSHVKLQLLVFLYKLSCSGTGGKFLIIGKYFKVSKGNARSCFHYVTYGLPNCIGIIDGTLLFLTETPEWSGEDFNTQKGGYGLNALVVCDDQCRVLYYYAGWPGSTHDNRSWRNCNLNLKEDKYFDDIEYIIGDSAFNPS
jgi:hypothetical protein